MADLREKVRTILWEETSTDRTLAWDRLVSRPDRGVSEMEHISRFWGFAFGLAYGIARGEDPHESAEDVATRAYEIAHDLFKDDDLHGLDFIRALEAGKSPVDAVSA